MTPSEFVEALQRFVLDTAVSDSVSVIEAPPGRSPPKRLIDASGVYKTLTIEQKELMVTVAREAAHAAVFGLLAVLDGVRAVDERHGKFSLVYVSDGEQSVLTRSTGEMLHELLGTL